MATMTERYIPTWERQYDPWDLEPDTNMDFLDEETDTEEIEDVEISELELDEDYDN